jgi:hypothetical protein
MSGGQVTDGVPFLQTPAGFSALTDGILYKPVDRSLI